MSDSKQSLKFKELQSPTWDILKEKYAETILIKVKQTNNTNKTQKKKTPNAAIRKATRIMRKHHTVSS